MIAFLSWDHLWWNVSPLSLSLTHMDHPLNVDHHNNFTLHVYVGYTFKHRVELQEILIWSLVQRSNPIIKASKLLRSLSFGYLYLFWTMEQNNMLTVIYKKKTSKFLISLLDVNVALLRVQVHELFFYKFNHDHYNFFKCDWSSSCFIFH